MTSLARFTALCLIASPVLTGATARAQDPVVIERAPDDSASAEVDALRTANRRLESELQNARAAIERLNTDLSTAQSARIQQEAALKDSARELATLRARLARLENAPKVAAPAPDTETLKKLETAQSTIDVLVAKNQQLDSNLAKRTTELHDAQSALAAARTASAESAQKANTDAVAAAAREKSRADEAVARLNTLVAGSTRLQEENQTLKNQLADLRRAETGLREQLASTATEKPDADLSARLADTEAKLTTALRAQSLAQAENELLKTKAAERGQAAAASATLQKEKAALESQLADARANAESLRQQLDGATSAAPDRSRHVAELESKLEAALRSYTLLQQENDNLKTSADELATLRDQVNTLRDEKAALENQLAATSAAEPSPETTRKLAEVEDKLATTLRSFSLLQEENDRLKADAAQTVEAAHTAAAKSAADSATQISALFNELRQTRAQLASLAAENSELKTRLALARPAPGGAFAAPSRPGNAAAAPAEPAATPPPAADPAPRTHVVILGDTLAGISRQYYGTPNRWEEILRANAATVSNPNALTVGMALRIP